VSDGRYYDAVAWRRARGDDAPWFQPGGAFYLGSHAPEDARLLMRETVRFGAQTVREMMAAARVPVARIEALSVVQPRRWVPGAVAEALDLPVACAPGRLRRGGQPHRGPATGATSPGRHGRDLRAGCGLHARRCAPRLGLSAV
jgi:hypothetical protein